MTYPVTLSNKVNERLKALKGARSYSAVIEELLNTVETLKGTQKKENPQGATI